MSRFDIKCNEVLSEVLRERFRQESLWGPQDHDPMVWLAILAEEFGEVAKEVCDSSIALGGGKTEKMLAALKNYRTELIQVAAVAVAMVESYDRNEGSKA
jgi:NTP pyrophosphatase (non-canonical NTP hydrolase)